MQIHWKFHFWRNTTTLYTDPEEFQQSFGHKIKQQYFLSSLYKSKRKKSKIRAMAMTDISPNFRRAIA